MTLTSQFRDILRENVTLADRTWLGIGGTAEWFAEPEDLDQLAALVKHCRDEGLAVRVLGGGSNLLVRDEGVKGVVVSLAGGEFLRTVIDDNQVHSGCGAQLAHVISAAVGAGLAGLEALVGIPGTVGGALHGNSGTHAGDIGQWTRQATVLTRSGELLERQEQDLVFAYRQSSLDELAIVAATFVLEREDPNQLARRMQKQWIATKASQPMTHENAICVFKDPHGLKAEMLIEQAGLKASAVGGAEVSARHANFIVAHQGATSTDVLKLVEMLREEVAQRTGVELQLQLEVW